jgi:hypothetical protein
MEREESEFEVVVAAVAVGSALEEADLIVGAFQGAGGDWVIVPVQDPTNRAHDDRSVCGDGKRGVTSSISWT